MTMAAIEFEEVAVFSHVSVMLSEVLTALEPARGGVFVDATAGGAGHSASLLAASPNVRVIACDRDPLAVRTAQARLAQFGERALVMHASFDQIPERLAEAGITQIDGLLADLGLSSQQLADADRGMSFRSSGPLDMRMDPSRGETALELIARLSQDELANVIYELGEERRSRRVARCIKQAFEAGELKDTLELRRAVVRAVGPRRLGGVDPATKTFQALRIAVNGELDQLSALLGFAKQILAPGGIAAIISFHSLEDRLVKRAFLEREFWQRLSNKPILAGERELSDNPRARSAKLRAALRVEVEPASDREPWEDAS
ncbi:MAG TPA: 16S rRNA (cytosine(1402)-N(4))-methyltransferase RsmH [Polyangiaceae bacterium]|jgi:16S rRNA (cytosine1402-N4)-methyltransferase|nr:16S rRNA (cytosine(1402)-N(4))-methyltransferase RsmH [Polyangiaceae bacterium]